MNIKEKSLNHGITLIALIITIIVMLILVAVTITMAVNGGLFGQAANAGKKTNEVVALEQALGEGRIKIGDYWYDSPQDYVNGKKSDNQEDGAQVNPETPTEPENPEKPGITAADIVGNEKLYYGKKVGDYEIFHSDGENIYLVSGSGGRSWADMTELSELPDGHPALKWFYDSNEESYELLGSGFGQRVKEIETSEEVLYSFGSIPFRMFVESYNKVHDNKLDFTSVWSHDISR